VERRALGLVVAALLLTSCTTVVESEPTVVERTPIPSLFSAPADMVDHVYRVEEVLYQVLCGDSEGSGFGMTSKRDGVESSFIVTNYHLVEQCLDGQEITVVDTYYNSFTAEVMIAKYVDGGYSPKQRATDLALLQPNAETFQTISDYSYAYQLGSWVMVAGFPDVSSAVKSMVITTGVISSKAEPFGFTTTAATSPGSSGSMVMNSRGEVIGVVYASYEIDQVSSTGMFLPLTRVAELLNEFQSQ